MIAVQLIVGRDPVARLDALPGRVRDGLVGAVTRLGFALQRRVQEELSSAVLEVRTGSPRGSINARIENTATEISTTVGTNIPYGRAHGAGFAGTSACAPICGGWTCLSTHSCVRRSRR